MAGVRLIQADVIRRQLEAVFQKWGMAPEHIATTVDAMVATDLSGVDSHGLGMLPSYHERRGRGIINDRPNIRVVREKAAVGLIDADRSLGHPPSVMAMQLAAKKAKEVGVAVVGVRNSNHFGAAGYYSRMAAELDVVGMAMTNAPKPAMVPTFGRDSVLGTNPIAFAAPAAKNPPFSLDMATTTVAMGKLNIARRLGKDIPSGWALNETGEPVTDGAAAFAMRRLTPLGGDRDRGSHKGYGLATMVEILCAVLTGAWSDGPGDDGAPTRTKHNVGHFFMAIDPAQVRSDGEFQDDMDRMIDMLHATPAVDPNTPVLVPGDPEVASRAERLENGIPVAETLIEETRRVAEESGAEFLFV
ncbi:MAG: Ldh family oxidoreductase [Alphaproteobacteria bacterium]